MLTLMAGGGPIVMLALPLADGTAIDVAVTGT
jgi:hypothetical protein